MLILTFFLEPTAKKALGTKLENFPSPVIVLSLTQCKQALFAPPPVYLGELARRLLLTKPLYLNDDVN